MLVVFDTNVVVSALLLTDSVPRRAFDKALGEGKILISVPALLELAEVLGRQKLNEYLLEDERTRFLISFLKEAKLVDVTEKISACRDPKDDKFLELAVGGGADYVVSGDADLLALNPFRGIPIVKPADFLSRF